MEPRGKFPVELGKTGAFQQLNRKKPSGFSSSPIIKNMFIVIF